MLRLPLRSDAKKTHAESGEKAGAFELFSPRVSCRRLPPSERAKNTWVTASLFSPSITGWASAQAVMEGEKSEAPGGRGHGRRHGLYFHRNFGRPLSPHQRRKQREQCTFSEHTFPPNPDASA